MIVVSRYGWWIGTMLGCAFVLALAGQFGVLHPFQSTFLRATAPFESRLGDLVRPISNAISDIGSFDDLREENAGLRLQIEAQQNQILELQRQTAELEDLQAAAGIISEADASEYRVARVIAAAGSAFDDVIRIDLGADDGVKDGMVVLSTQRSLVGTVIDVTATQSFVRLITDDRSAVNAQVFESKITGSLQGTARRTLTFRLAQGTINVGDTIVTSGIGGNYPPDLPIGRVSEVSGTAQDIERTVAVEPRVRMSSLETVLVLMNFTPQRLTLD